MPSVSAAVPSPAPVKKVVVPPRGAGAPRRLPPPDASRWHRVRKRVHLACFVVFMALPFFNVMRFDIPRARFYFAGQELWISEFGTLFFALMFLMFVIAAAAMFYGRVYCGYLCPQMIFSEASTSTERWLRKTVNRRFSSWPAGSRTAVTRILFYTLLLVASVFLSFVFIAYFVEPRDLFRRLLSLDVRTAGGIAGASTTLFTFLDFTFVRHRFCTTVCPYGYLQGMLADQDTLLVRYEDPSGDCIECRKCVRVCEMGIDIRVSPHQIECVHCGECIDACADVLGRLGRKTLIHYRWGVQGAAATREPWYHRIGLRDAKRVAVLFVLLFYASGLALALSMRHAVLVQIVADRTTLYTLDPAGQVINRFRVELANRSSGPAEVRLSVRGLANASMSGVRSPVLLPGGGVVQQVLEVAVPSGMAPPGVTHFVVVATARPEGTSEEFPQTFIAPAPPGKTP